MSAALAKDRPDTESVSHPAIVLSRPTPRELFERVLATVAAGARQSRRASILRCADAMGPERALRWADQNLRGEVTRWAAMKRLVREERARARREGGRHIDVSRMRESLAAMLWILRINIRDRAFWRARHQEKVA
jgi:hypothetical protein